MNNPEEKRKITFAVKYEGGHPMRDPAFLEKYRMARAIDPHYDKEGAKKTSMERYGEEHYSRTGEARKTSRENMSKLHESGKAYSGKNKKDCPDKKLLEESYKGGETVGRIALLFGVSEGIVSRWVKEYGLEREGSLCEQRKEVMPREDLLESYKKECLSRKELLSPYAFGKIKGDPSLVCKLKRILAKDPSVKDRIYSEIVV